MAPQSHATIGVAVSPERIDPKHLVDGRPPRLEAVCDEKSERVERYRFTVPGMTETRVTIEPGRADVAEILIAAAENRMAKPTPIPIDQARAVSR